jgi:hypothetical protein
MLQGAGELLEDGNALGYKLVGVGVFGLIAGRQRDSCGDGKHRKGEKFGHEWRAQAQG